MAGAVDNGVRATSQSDLTGPIQVDDYRTWHERHPFLAKIAKIGLPILLGGLVSALVLLVRDLRDDVRDNNAIRHAMPALRERLRTVEQVVGQQTEGLRWITRSLTRLEQAAGTQPVTGPQPDPPAALDPPPALGAVDAGATE